MKDKRWLKKDPTAWMRSRIFDTNDTLDHYIKTMREMMIEDKPIKCPICKGVEFMPEINKNEAKFKCTKCITIISIPKKDWLKYGIKTTRRKDQV